MCQLKPQTQRLYESAAQEFEQWCADGTRLGSSHEEVDSALTGFIHELCEDARPFTDASYAVFAWIALRSTLHMPEKEQLPFSKRALKGWKSRFPDIPMFGEWSLPHLRMAFPLKLADDTV